MSWRHMLNSFLFCRLFCQTRRTTMYGVLQNCLNQTSHIWFKISLFQIRNALPTYIYEIYRDLFNKKNFTLLNYILFKKFKTKIKNDAYTTIYNFSAIYTFRGNEFVKKVRTSGGKVSAQTTTCLLCKIFVF